MKASVVLLLLALSLPLQAQGKGPLDDYKDTSLKVSIVTRVLEEDSTELWNMESSEVTVSGETIAVKLQGEDIVILAELTPYLLDDGSILLMARGDVFLSSDEDGLTYKTTMKSMPVDPGEKVFFFPLGVAFDSEENIYTIQLEIQVDEIPHE